MDTYPDEAYVARCAFQIDLDRTFPEGAVCALLPMTEGRVQAAGRVEATGRLLCSNARPSESNGDWDYEILIDPRTRADRPREEVRVWITSLAPHPSVGGLWEAEVRGDGGDRLLRVNAAGPPDAMPGPAVRSAVTRAHEHDLFPQGLVE